MKKKIGKSTKITLKENEAAIIFKEHDTDIVIPTMKENSDVPYYILECAAIAIAIKDEKIMSIIMKHFYKYTKEKEI